MSGLSRTAVSFALNSRLRSRLKPETCERILQTAKQLGYRPHPLASGLRGARTHTIGILSAMGGARASGAMSRSLAIRMQRHGYATNVADHLEQAVDTRQLLADLATRKVEGVLMQGSAELLNDAEVVERLQQFPAAVVAMPDELDLPLDAVVQDRGSAVRSMVDYFAKTGRRRLAFVGELRTNPGKIEPLRQSAKEHGLPIRNKDLLDMTVRGQTVAAGAVASVLDARWHGRPDCDAIFCTNDLTAVNVLAWLKAKGVRVPEDVALVGFDNDPFAQHITPPLASVERRDERVAELLEAMLLRRLADKQLPRQRERVAMEFVWRESAGETK